MVKEKEKDVCVVLKKKRGSRVYSIQYTYLRIAFRSCGTNAKIRLSE